MSTAMSRDDVIAIVRRITTEPELVPLVTAAKHVSIQGNAERILHEVTTGREADEDFDPFARQDIAGMKMLTMILVGVHTLDVTVENFMEMFLPVHQVTSALLVYAALDGVGWEERLLPELFQNVPTAEELLNIVYGPNGEAYIG